MVEPTTIDSLSDIVENIKLAKVWHYKSILILQFHEYAQRISGAALPGNPGRNGKVGWGLRDTAKALTINIATLCEELKLARELQLNPELRRFKSKNLALNYIKGK